MKLGFRVPIVSEILVYKAQDSGFHEKKFPGIRMTLHGATGGRVRIGLDFGSARKKWSY